MANDREIQLLIKAKDEAQGVLSGHLKKLDELTQAHLGLSLKAVAAYAAVATGIVTATAAVYKFTSAQAELGDAMDEMSARTNMSVEDLSRFKYVLDQDGVSLQSFEGATRKLARAMYDAYTGGKEQQAAFAALGVEYVDADGKLIGVSEAMLRVFDGLKNTTSEAERTALMLTVLGRGSGDLAVTAERGSEGIKAEMADLDRLNGVMTESFAKSGAAMKDAEVTFKAAWDGLKRSLAEPFMEPFAKATNNAALAVSSMNKSLERHLELRMLLASMNLPGMAGGGGMAVGSTATNNIIGSLSTPTLDQLFGGSGGGTASSTAAASILRAGPQYWSSASGPADDTFELGNLMDGMDDIDAVLKEAATHSLVLKDNMAEVGSTGTQSAQMIGSAMASALEQAIFDAKDLDDILGGLARGFFSMGLTALLTPGIGFLGLESGGGIPHAAQGMSVRGGIPGMDSVLIRAQAGEEVLDRTLAADLRSYLASVRFSPGSASLKGAASTGGNYAVSINTMYPTRPADSRRIGRDIVRSIKEAERSTL